MPASFLREPSPCGPSGSAPCHTVDVSIGFQDAPEPSVRLLRARHAGQPVQQHPPRFERLQLLRPVSSAGQKRRPVNGGRLIIRVQIGEEDGPGDIVPRIAQLAVRPVDDRQPAVLRLEDVVEIVIAVNDGVLPRARRLDQPRQLGLEIGCASMSGKK